MTSQARTSRWRTPRLATALLAGMLLSVALGSLVVRRTSAASDRARATPSVPTDVSTPETNGADVVNMQVEHTLFHPSDDVVMLVERMEGRMVGKPGQIISLDDPGSFSVYIDKAVTRLSAHDLSALINGYLLRRAGSDIRHVDVSFDGQQVVIKGQVHKLLTLPFEGHGVLSATPEGELRMHMDEFRVAGVLNRSFLAFFGIRLDDVAQPKRRASFRVEGDDFLTSLNELFPPPKVFGRLTRVHVEKQDLVQEIGVAPVPHAIQTIPKALPEPANYIYFTGGRMRFGRVTMDNVDLKMVDQTPNDPFDFSLQHYQQQIESGYVKVMPNLGLVVYAGDVGVPGAHKPR